MTSYSPSLWKTKFKKRREEIKEKRRKKENKTQREGIEIKYRGRLF